MLEKDRDHEIDLDAQDIKGETPLTAAVRNDHPAVVMTLLTARMYAIDPHLPDQNGVCAVDYARITPLIQSYFTTGLAAIQATRVTFRRHLHVLLNRDLPVVLRTLMCDYLFRSF